MPSQTATQRARVIHRTRPLRCRAAGDPYRRGERRRDHREEPKQAAVRRTDEVSEQDVKRQVDRGHVGDEPDKNHQAVDELVHKRRPRTGAILPPLPAAGCGGRLVPTQLDALGVECRRLPGLRVPDARRRDPGPAWVGLRSSSDTIQIVRKPAGRPKIADAMVCVRNHEIAVEPAADHVVGRDAEAHDHPGRPRPPCWLASTRCP